MLGVGGGREVIGLQVAPSGTEDPEEKPEVRHLTGGGPSEKEIHKNTSSSISLLDSVLIKVTLSSCS